MYLGGYYGLVVVTPPRPHTLHRLRDNLKNPCQIVSINANFFALGPYMKTGDYFVPLLYFCLLCDEVLLALKIW